jgi:hypothetical protein
MLADLERELKVSKKMREYKKADLGGLEVKEPAL